MIVSAPLVLGLSLIVFPQYQETNKFSESISYSDLVKDEPRLKDTMHYDTMTNEELVRENNNKIIQQIYKNLE